MRILIFGTGSTISTTTYQMLDSVDGWSVSGISSLNGTLELETSDIDVIVANLGDFSIPPTSLIKKIISQFSDIPVLALSSYDKELLIEPLLQAGARGYLKNGSSEKTLISAVKSIAEGKKIIITENT